MAVKIAANTAQFNAALASSQKNLQSFTKSAEGVGKQITTALSFVGIGAGVGAATQAIGSAINIIKDFEQQMATVKAITGASGAEFDALRKSALDLGAATKFTATEVAQLQTEYGRLGFSTQEILNATKATLSLSVATGEDLAKSADILGSTLRAFGLDASETARVADVMAGSFNKSALGLENYGEAIKYVAPVAAAANISLEETTALLGILADNGIRGSQAGTSLRKIISDVGGETGTLTERLKKLADKGLTGADAMDEVGRTAYASLLILTKNADKTANLTKELQNVKGAADEAAAVMGDTLAGDLDKLSSAYDSLVLSGGPFADMLREVVQAGTNLINAFSSSATDGVLAFLGKLVSYTPNLYTLSKAINYVSKNIELTREEAIKYIAEAKKFRDAAIQSGDQEKVKTFTAIIAQLTSKYGLLRDKAVEYKEKEEDIAQVIPKNIENYDAMKERLSKLNAEFETLDVTNRKVLASRGREIIQLTKNIAEIDAYRQAQKKANDEKRKEFDLFNASRQSIFGQAEAYEKMKSEIDKAQKSLGLFLNQFNAVSVLPEKVNISEGLSQQMADLRANLQQGAKEIIDIGPQIANGIADVAASIGEALATQDFSNFGQNILEAVASFAQQLGAQLIALGVAEVALKAAAGNPVALIAAGAALVAAGAAVKATIGKQGKVISGAAGGGGGGTSVGSNAANTFDSGGNKIVIGGQFKIAGRDLVLAINNENIRKDRLG